ncbi:DUF262 domain-containing protein [Desulfovibrio piger]|uniref:GmrSD restriction endonucleases N-terminal domain-containing protein n=1 Tax=Desulfovibrio piger TaxID=901 RepID=A0A1K1LCL2_9BACT|nr:DUF262 domain-containing protein [Desulfovibrio piger]SFV72457.1 hypothetical protein DESPIGER_0572 [Desulfovibrio piger]
MAEETLQTQYDMDTVLVPEAEVEPEGSDTSTPPEEKEERITQPFDTRAIRIESKSGNMNTLLSRLENDEIDLAPDFQRLGGIWNKTSQSRLMESLMLRIPIPAFYFDGTDDEKWLVVDGLQRLTAIRRFVIDQDLKLCDLEYLKEHEGKTFSELPRPLQRAIREADLVWYLIMPGTPDNVKFDVFRRINTGGLPLSSQEIRHALNGKPVTDVIRKLAESEEFKQATAYGLSDKRMDDRECVTRFLVFAVFPPESYDKDDFDAFLNTGMRYLNTHAELLDDLQRRFLRAMRAAERIFGNDAFRKRYYSNATRFPVNKALFESWSVNLDTCTDEELQMLEQKKDNLKEAFMRLMREDSVFEKAVTQGTGSISRVRCRFQAIRELIQGVLYA